MVARIVTNAIHEIFANVQGTARLSGRGREAMSDKELKLVYALCRAYALVV